MTQNPHDDAQQQDQPEVEPDVGSDPALDVDTGSEWSDEGGAVEEGPATDPEDDPDAV